MAYLEESDELTEDDKTDAAETGVSLSLLLSKPRMKRGKPVLIATTCVKS